PVLARRDLLRAADRPASVRGQLSAGADPRPPRPSTTAAAAAAAGDPDAAVGDDHEAAREGAGAALPVGSRAPPRSRAARGLGRAAREDRRLRARPRRRADDLAAAAPAVRALGRGRADGP